MKFLACFALAALALLATRAKAADNAAEIYTRHVLPLIETDQKSSCSQCHLRGVQLKDFLDRDQAKTFAELRARGWIDVDAPEKSKLLEFVSKSDASQDELIDRLRQRELAALTDWIRAAAKDPNLLKQPLPQHRDLELPLDFIRHARKDRVLANFADAVWSQLGRCVNCHSPDRNAKYVREHGSDMSWIVPGDPDKTLQLLVQRGLIDVNKPEESAIRTKPLALVEHGGGPKFVKESEIAVRWTAFLEDYARTVRSGENGYRPVDKLPSLPDRRAWLSDLQIRLTDVPSELNGRLVVVTLHSQDSNGQTNPRVLARSDSLVNEKQHVWQQQLTFFQPAQDLNRSEWFKPVETATFLPRGKYVLQAWLQEEGTDANPAIESGHTRLKRLKTWSIDAPWPPGYQPPKIVAWDKE